MFHKPRSDTDVAKQIIFKLRARDRRGNKSDLQLLLDERRREGSPLPTGLLLIVLFYWRPILKELSGPVNWGMITIMGISLVLLMWKHINYVKQLEITERFFFANAPKDLNEALLNAPLKQPEPLPRR